MGAGIAKLCRTAASLWEFFGRVRCRRPQTRRRRQRRVKARALPASARTEAPPGGGGGGGRKLRPFPTRCAVASRRASLSSSSAVCSGGTCSGSQPGQADVTSLPPPARAGERANAAPRLAAGAWERWSRACLTRTGARLFDLGRSIKVSSGGIFPHSLRARAPLSSSPVRL